SSNRRRSRVVLASRQQLCPSGDILVNWCRMRGFSGRTAHRPVAYPLLLELVPAPNRCRVRRTSQIVLLGTCLVALLLPAVAQAQWYPYPPYPRYPYPYYALDNLRSAVRIEVSPNDAEVYVDGYYAGIVDDFDGVFQRLRVTP